MTKYLLRLKNASQVVLITTKNKRFLTGKEMNNIEILENASILINKDGKISKVYKSTPESESKYEKDGFDKDINCEGKSIIPGLVDCHTHPVWDGDRCHEFAMKMRGASYTEIHKAGGGIGFTVKHTRNASKSILKSNLRKRLNLFTKNGTTLLEAKSGYGLDTKTEIKMLETIHEVSLEPQYQNSIDILSTYLGGHSVPKSKTLEQYTDEIINQQIPSLKKSIKDGKISPTFIDVFHETGFFETKETEKVLKEGKEKLGLEINFHGDEIKPMGSAELAVKLGATAVCHCENISSQGMKDMKEYSKKNPEKPVVAVLLPTTSYILRISHPPARKLIDSEVPVALSTDFNPNAYCFSLPFVMNLSVIEMKMTLNESLVASTLNAACALGKSDLYGSIEEGKFGDFVILNEKKWEHIIYQMGPTDVISGVIKKGKIVF